MVAVSVFYFPMTCQAGNLQLVELAVSVFVCSVSALCMVSFINVCVNSGVGIVFMQGQFSAGGLLYKAHVSACSLLAEYIVQLYARIPSTIQLDGQLCPPISCNRLSIPTSHESLLQTRETSASLPHQSFLDNTTSSLGLVNTMC